MPARSWAPLLFFSQQRGKEERNLIPLYLSLFQKLIEVLFVKVGVLYTCISAQWVADLQILFPSSWYISYLSLCVKKISSPCPFFFVWVLLVFFFVWFSEPPTKANPESEDYDSFLSRCVCFSVSATWLELQCFSLVEVLCCVSSWINLDAVICISILL